jgi:hypothetical protein
MGNGKATQDSDKSSKLDENVERNKNRKPVASAPAEIGIVLDDSKDGQQDKDVKRTLLQILGDIADFHERIKKYV